MMLDFGEVAWPVQPGSEDSLTRPARFVNELARRGVRISAFVTHGRGRARSTSHGATSRSTGRPWASLTRPGPAALLTPLVARLPQQVAWADMYDDWTLSPLIPSASRFIAHRTYNRLEGQALRLTVNTEYMRLRLGGAGTIIPNGCDERFAESNLQKASGISVVVLGSLDRRRCDRATVDVVLARQSGLRVLAAGPGTQLLVEVSRGGGGEVDRRAHVDLDELAHAIDPRTIAWLPLRVSDYTLSQDPMKLYVYLALGLRVVMPHLLIPPHLRSHPDIFAYESASDARDLLITLSRLDHAPSVDARRRFVADHGWRARGEALMRVLVNGG